MALFTAIAAAVTAISSWTIGLGALGSFAVGNFILRAAVQLGVGLLTKAFAGEDAGDPFSIQGSVRVGGDVPRSFGVGPFLTAGSLAFHTEWGEADGTPNAFYTQVIALSDLPVSGLRRWFIEGSAVTLATTESDNGFAANEYTENGVENAWIKFHDGTQSVADPFLTGTVSLGAPRSYGVSRVGFGMAYAIVTFRVNQGIFTGFPKSKFVMDGVKLYDISRDSSAGGVGAQRWNDPATWGGDGDALPAVQAYNYARGIYYRPPAISGVAQAPQWFYGLQGLSAARLPAAHWVSQVNKCRAPIAGVDGLEPTYRCAGEIAVNSEIGSAFDATLTSCAGRMSEVGGVFKIYVGAPDAPIAHFTDADIVSLAPQTFTPFFGWSNTVNGVIGTFPSPDEGYVMRSTPPLYNPAFEVEDGNRRLMTDVSMAFVPFEAQAQRLLAGELKAARRARRHTHTMPARYRKVEPGDVVTWDSARNGYTAKQFRVDGVIDLPNCDLIIDITEVDPSDHGSWVHSVDYVPISTVPAVSVRPAAQPFSGWSVQKTSVTSAGSSTELPAILAGWDGTKADVVAVRVQVRVLGETLPVFDGRFEDVSQGSAVISQAILGGTLYQARGMYVPGTPRASEWGDWLGVTTDEFLIAPGGISQAVWDQVGLDAAAQADLALQEFRHDEYDPLAVDYASLKTSVLQGLGVDLPALRDDLATLRLGKVSTIELDLTRLNDALDQVSEDAAQALTIMSRTGSLVAGAGIQIDEVTGEVYISAFRTQQGEIAEVSQRLSAAEGLIDLRVTVADFSDLSTTVNTVETTLDGVAASLTSKASAVVVEGLDVRLGTAEVSIDALQGEISSKVEVADFGDAVARIGSAEQTLSAIDIPSITSSVVDIRRVSDDLDQLADDSIEGLISAYRGQDALRIDFAAAEQTLSAGITDLGEAVSTARTELATSIEGNLAQFLSEAEARSSADAAIVTTLNALTATVGENAGRITQETSLRVDADEVIAEAVTALTATVGDNAGQITQEASLRIEADAVIAQAVTALTATVGGNTSAVQQVAEAVSSEGASLRSTVFDVRLLDDGVDLLADESVVDMIARYRADDAVRLELAVARSDLSAGITELGEAVAASRTELLSEISGNAAGLLQEATTRANDVSAITQALSVLGATVGANEASITSEATARADAVSAVAGVVQTLTATVGDQATAIQQTATATAGVGATVQFELDTNGHISGFRLTSEVQADDAVRSAMTFLADTFQISGVSGEVSPFVVYTVPTVVGGITVPAGVYMRDVFIQNGAINTLKLAGNSVTVPSSAQGSQQTGGGATVFKELASTSIFLNEASPILIFWSIEHGYSSGGPSWSYELLHNGVEVAARAGMSGLNDFPGSHIMVAGVAGWNTVILDWAGSSSAIIGRGRVTIMGAQR